MVACVFCQGARAARGFDHIENPQERNILGKGLTVSEDLVVEHAVDVTLRAGEMSFHHANIVHGSNPNTAASRRVGFAVRYVAAAVKQTKRHHAVILARTGQVSFLRDTG